MKIAVIYHSESGNTRTVAEIIGDGAGLSGEVEVRCMSVDEVDLEFLGQSSAVIWGTPTYCGSFSWPVKQWLDTHHGLLGGKLGAVFATERHIGGGADLAELTLIGHLLVHGMLVYSAGASEGAPFTHLGAVCINSGDEAQKERARIFGTRIAAKAKELFA